jgi:site-specific recombinase XerD
MNTEEMVTYYIAFRRTLGEKFQTNESILRAFCQAVGPQTSIAGIGVEAVVTFLNGSGSITSGWFKKHQALNGFFRFAIDRGHLTEAPLPKVLPQRPPSFVPYIYTRDEIRQLLSAIPSSQDYRNLIKPDTFRAILLVLYGAGLRVREALSLSVADVDLPNGLITVRDSKFFKSRLVPIGPQLAGVLTEYAQQRAASHPGKGKEGPFFLDRRGAAILLQTMDKTFKRLRGRAGIRRSDGARYQPRLHDLRHSFAVHRLIKWYQQGADVQRLIYHLSVYLGHVHLRHTQVYLTMTPELLQHAGSLFERYASKEGHHA